MRDTGWGDNQHAGEKKTRRERQSKGDMRVLYGKGSTKGWADSGRKVKTTGKNREPEGLSWEGS